MDVSLEVVKEPRGFIRILQCLMAILAFATTASFSTECKFQINCDTDDRVPVDYDIGYPFTHTELEVPVSCDKSGDLVKFKLPYDFSNSAEFFVATGVLSFLYTLAIMVVYIFFHQLYSSNNKLPVIDLACTTVLSVFWLAGSSAWAQGVTDLKYYLHPDTMFTLFTACKENGETRCTTVVDGSYGTLNASLILGFANFVIWVASLWFVYKETVFHNSQTATAPEPNQNQTSKVGRV